MGNLDGLGYEGATVVVTGCASGMGEATAKAVGDLGAKVHAVDVRTPTVPRVGKEGFAGGIVTGALDPAMLGA